MKLLMLYLLMILSFTPLSLLAEITHQNPKVTLQLTDQEQEWLMHHPVIYVGMDSDYAPYEWLSKEGHYMGLAVDYLRLIEQRLGVRFEMVRGKTWSELLAMAKRGEIDILTSIVQTPERQKFFLFSEPYRDTQTMILDNGKGEFIGRLENLIGKKVAVEKGYFTQELLEEKYPKINLVLTQNIAEALLLVRDGKADAYIGDMSAINYAIKTQGLEQLRFSGQTEFSSQHRFAFPKVNKEFATIMEKAMASISNEESNIILSRWIGLRVEQGIRTQTVLLYGTMTSIIFTLFVYFYYRLQREIKSRKAAEIREKHRNTVLEMIAKMEPLIVVLESIVKEVEANNPSMLCSVLLLDKEGKFFEQVIAPRLPDFYNRAIQGLAIGKGVGSCGTAAYLKERVIAENIETHPYWKDYKEIALHAGLHSCWSEAIVSSDGKALGTFAIYHLQPQVPTKTDILLIEQSANLANIAIEKSLAATKLRESEEMYRRLTEEVTDVIWRTDKDLFITYISPSDEKFRGYKASEVVGRHVFEMFTQEGVLTIQERLKKRQEAEEQGISTDVARYEIPHVCKDGRILWGEIVSKPERNDKGEIIGYHGITREITERKMMQDKVQELAFYDVLTKLPNRLLLKERLNYTLAEMKRHHHHGAVLFLDLDNFKSLNDTHGHSVGDLLLCQVASRLKECVREIDTVARFGGDEFIVILNELHKNKDEAIIQAQKIAEKIRQALAIPYILNPAYDLEKEQYVEHSCSASIGILVFDSHEKSQDDLLKRADFAMYKAKEQGKNAIAFYE